MKRFLTFFVLLTVIFSLPSFSRAQETTGALEGTVKDPTGAVVPDAKVSVTTPTLVGAKTTESDSKGYYHFSNLPPGAYLVTVEAHGFATLKREGLVIEVGHLPTLDLTVQVGSESQIVDVTSESPQIDVTTVTTQTNITQDVINYVPRGRSFQSVIQFAPGASQEPLMGNASTGAGGTGAGSPGSQSNGQSYGYSVAGGSDSENSYLVEGQETANLIGGYSHTNVPFDFIKEVAVTSSGVEAEYGGALGGVVNVIMQKGTSQYHGSVFAVYENQGFDAAPSGRWIYNPASTATDNPLIVGGAEVADLDQAVEFYLPKKSHYSIVQPGFTLGGPLFPFWSKMKDRVFFFVGFNPELDRTENKINYNQAGSGNPGLGVVPFSQNTNTYYTNARIDARVTNKIRVFGSWLYQLQREYGESTPGLGAENASLFADSANGLYNPTTTSAPSVFAHTQGFDAPNITVNTGADITIMNNLISTSRFGYYFENYHDFGYPTANPTYVFETSGTGTTAANGGPLDPSLDQAQGYQSQGSTLETFYNANKAIQLDQDFAWYKSGWGGTHNFKFGYQLNRRSNLLSEAYNAPLIDVYVGQPHTTSTAEGVANCPGIAAADGTTLGVNTAAGTDSCQGQFGWIQDYDYGASGSAISYNHSLFAQDAWSLKHGVTLNLGIRVEKEYLPGEVEGPGVPPNPISFGWGDKIAPRLGAAWDVMQNGKIKLFGSYGVFNDTMKLNLAISSFGGEYWNECDYAYNAGALSTIDATYNSSKRACPGLGDNSTVNWAGGTTPAGLQFIESVNERAAVVTCATCNPYEEAVAPHLKPYRQHEALGGVDFQLSRTLALEVRYNRRRLDHVIEDSSIFNPAIGETFVIVNPGQGVDATFTGFCNFLYSTGPNNCTSPTGAYPPNQTIPAARSYDGLEFRLNKAMSDHWFAMVSYTYSHFRGNYTGLTSSDQADDAEGSTGGGRDAPNNSRAFDEPNFSYNADGGSSSGLLPTDRPSKIKAYAYYEAKFLHNFTSDFGIFQYIYQGSPNTSFIQDMGDTANEDFPMDVFDRGKWADISQNQNTGAVTVGNTRTYRNPVYAETDFNFNQSYKISGSKVISFAATFTNLFNEHAVTAVNEQVDSASNYINGKQAFDVNGLGIGDAVPWYAAVMSPFSVPSLLQANPGSVASIAAAAAVPPGPGDPTGTPAVAAYNAPQSISNLYGKPYQYQLPRTIRLSVHFTF
jgi:Carboxypeptidase regulatory-like domain